MTSLRDFQNENSLRQICKTSETSLYKGKKQKQFFDLRIHKEAVNITSE